MNDPLDNAKTMRGTPIRDTIGDMLTQQPDQAVILDDRYHIVRKLGEGGMGSVWLAEDTKLDGRQVAIKMLPVVLFANKRAIQQLKSEAKVAIQLAHPNIATLRAFEESEQGPFLVMDYISGHDLEDILANRGVLPEDEVMRIFEPVANALDYAHGQKVIHRDVKPSNILIRDDGTPFITDFGIAREMKDTMTRVTGRSTSGTVPYMSPEQLRGEVPSPSQDVYSLAATMYECFAGHPPFHRGQIEYQIVNEAPPPIPAEHSALFGPIQAALSKTPGRRPRSCIELVAPSPTFEPVVEERKRRQEVQAEHSDQEQTRKNEEQHHTASATSASVQKTVRPLRTQKWGYVLIVAVGIFSAFLNLVDEDMAGPVNLLGILPAATIVFGILSARPFVTAAVGVSLQLVDLVVYSTVGGSIASNEPPLLAAVVVGTGALGAATAFFRRRAVRQRTTEKAEQAESTVPS